MAARRSTPTRCSSTAKVPLRGPHRRGRRFHHLLHGLNPERVLIAAEAIGIGAAALRRRNTPRSAPCSAGRSARTGAIQHPLPRAGCSSGGQPAGLQGGMALRQRQGMRRRGQLGQYLGARRLRCLRERAPSSPRRLGAHTPRVPRRALPARGHDRAYRAGQRAAYLCYVAERALACRSATVEPDWGTPNIVIAAPRPSASALHAGFRWRVLPRLGSAKALRPAAHGCIVAVPAYLAASRQQGNGFPSEFCTPLRQRPPGFVKHHARVVSNCRSCLFRQVGVGVVALPTTTHDQKPMEGFCLSLLAGRVLLLRCINGSTSIARLKPAFFSRFSSGRLAFAGCDVARLSPEFAI